MESEVQVTLTVVEGGDEGKSLRLRQSRTTIGRKRADFALTDRKVSQLHAAVLIAGNKVTIEDLRSRNGFTVNGLKVSHSELKNLDEITLGTTKLKVLIVDDLEAFRSYNRAEGAEGVTDGDIGSLISDELKRFSRWDLTPPSRGLTSIPRKKLPWSFLVVEGPEAGRKIRLSGEVNILGRGQVDVNLADPDVSREHARLEATGTGQLTLVDLKSTNGTEVNGEFVRGSDLREGDEIRVGGTLLRLVRDG